MKYHACLLALLAFAMATPSLLAQKVTLPSKLECEAREWLIVPAEVDGGVPKWELSPGLQEVRLDLVFPPEALKSMKGKVVKASAPGTYTVRAWNAKGDVASDIAVCTIVVGGTPPAPPTPPVPPAPGPQSELAKTFQAAYDQERDAALLASLQGVMSSAPKQIALPATKTNKQLTDAVHMACDAEVGVGRLAKTRAAVGKYLNERLPFGEMAFTDETRAMYVKAYEAAAKALLEVRP